MPSYPYDHNWVKVRAYVLKRDGHRCQIAGDRCTGTATEVDHIVPLIEGGPRLDPRNLRAACKPCNASRVNRRTIALTAAIEAQSAPNAQRW